MLLLGGERERLGVKKNCFLQLLQYLPFSMFDLVKFGNKNTHRLGTETNLHKQDDPHNGMIDPRKWLIRMPKQNIAITVVENVTTARKTQTLNKAGIAYPMRGPGLIPGLFYEVRVTHLLVLCYFFFKV